MSALTLRSENIKTRTGPKLASDERRRSERKPHIIEAWLRPGVESAAEPIEVTGLNISQHGAGFVARQELRAGTFWWVEIGLGTQRMSTEIRVVSCRENDTGGYAVGAEFC